MRRKIVGLAYGASSLSVFTMLIVMGNAGSALAQGKPRTTTPAQPVGPAAEATNQDIIVTGSRASQQTANQRKKNAKTATDSLVADDIGSFPDRNVNEAISRLPGVALNRDAFGEGESIDIRGNGADLTRVELDGIGIQNTNGLDGARGADMRELPAELVKSVDVVKGATADMTEGSLGGSVQVKTRSGLDFAKPYFSFRTGAQQNSLGRTWTPDFNAVASRKFFGGRLGVIVSGNYADVESNGHTYQQTTSGRSGYARFYDFDQSPEKTFTYNLDTLGGDTADNLFANSTETPRSLLTKSAGAATKAECLSVLPIGTLAGNARVARIQQQQTCLNQWNDYTPSLIRNLMQTRRDKRYSYDARVDFRVSDQLVVFAKGTVANRKGHDQFRTRSPISLLTQNALGTFVDSTTGVTRSRTVSPNAPAGYYLFDPQFGLNNVGGIPTFGNVLNVIPGSIVMDGKHNVTAMTLTNNSVNIDQIENTMDIKTRYMQGGAEFRGDRVDIDAMVGMTKAASSLTNLRTARSAAFGEAKLQLQGNGLWDIKLPDNFDDGDPANFVNVTAPRCIGTGTAPSCIGQTAVAPSVNGPGSPAYTVGQMPLTTPSFGAIFRPSMSESSERIGKIDLTFRTDEIIPFITRIKYGAMYRRNTNQFWGGGGSTPVGSVGTFGQPGYVPAVVVPTANVSGTIRACQPTAGSTAPGGLSCNYGFVPSTNPGAVRSGVDTLTPAQLSDLFKKTLEQPGSKYFGDLPNRGNLPQAWKGIRSDQLFAALGASKFMNFDCLEQCQGSDGKMYDQPTRYLDESIVNIYGMFDYSQKLPFGLVADGNIGLRGVYTNVKGTGQLTLNIIRTTPSFDPLNPNVSGGTVTQAISQNTTATASAWNWLPTGNLNLWAFNRRLVLRMYAGKTVARPTPAQLLASGNCNIDQRVTLDLDGDGEELFDCPGRIGNPALQPYTAWNYNLALEWYPNRDTVLSATFGRLDVKLGGGIGDTRTGTPFTGTDRIDPLTGKPLSELEFTYPTFRNGPGFKRNIFEFSAKTAFTFLPWFLRNTGADANISFLASKATDGTREPLTGAIMAPTGQSRYYLNSSIWYDDGTLNMRLAYQRRTEIFECIAPCGQQSNDQNYPGNNWSNIRLPYNPGAPIYKEGTQFFDFKIAYNVTRQVQIYLEGRNLTRETQTRTQGKTMTFEDGTPRVTSVSYGGRRILVGGRIALGRPGGRR